ncbi:MAG TPA: hypothetical protein DCX60_08345 [Phycisphaerales bacterium]|nr:hypothetical protein [Phycisphaerales bacterium]
MRPRRSSILLITAMLGIVLGVSTILILSTPASFLPPRPALVDSASERARLFERAFVSELTRIRRPEAQWGVRIREEDLNAWLWVRLPEWVSHVGGDELSAFGSMQSILASDRMLLTSADGVFAFEPIVGTDGLSLLPRAGNSLGRLPVPGTLVRLFDRGFEFSRMLGSFGGITSQGSALPTRYQLGDGRTVELLETRLGDGELVLVFQTSSERRSTD